jgi:hypothetical protein
MQVIASVVALLTIVSVEDITSSYAITALSVWKAALAGILSVRSDRHQVVTIK